VSAGDYLAQSKRVTFLPGQTSKTLRISIKGDRRRERNETFFVNLKAPTNAVLAKAMGTGTILNDD
jgi:hypothetical protein